MFKKEYSAETEKAFITVVLRSEDGPDGETFDSLIGTIKREHPELTRSASEARKQDEEILRREPHKMSQREYEEWAKAKERVKRR